MPIRKNIPDINTGKPWGRSDRGRDENSPHDRTKPLSGL